MIFSHCDTMFRTGFILKPAMPPGALMDPAVLGTRCFL
jgi:hypothetical protein